MRRKDLVREFDALKQKVALLDASFSELMASYKEIKEDMRGHDEDFEKFLTGMSNMMNYSYTTALEAERHE